MLFEKGLVIGKFMPAHKGHEYLFRFAQQYCRDLTIVVDCLKAQTIPVNIRVEWIRELMPSARVIGIDEFMPQDPSETPEFWNIWRTKLKQLAGDVDVVVASMDYGHELARQLDAKFVQCDLDLQSVPISATKIRADVGQHWDYLTEPAKGYFLKKYCFIGPESTGKSTLAKNLAKERNTVYVPEYAQRIITDQGGSFHFENATEVAYAQIRGEKALERIARRDMFCDSDVITTMVWAEQLFGKYPSELEAIAVKSSKKDPFLSGMRGYDHTFLFYPDTPWQPDKHRNVTKSDSDKFRLDMFCRMKDMLDKYNRAYTVLKGSFEDKRNTVLEYINTNG